MLLPRSIYTRWPEFCPGNPCFYITIATKDCNILHFPLFSIKTPRNALCSKGSKSQHIPYLLYRKFSGTASVF